MDEDIYPNGLTFEEALAAMNADDADEETPSVEDVDGETPETEVDEEETEEEGDEESDDEGNDDEVSDEDAEDEAEAEGPKLADDEAEVEYTVNGESKRVSVKDLKRLAGQEAALTQRSQSLAEQRKAIEAQGLVAAKLIENQYEKAKAQLDRYKDVDLNIAAKELDREDYEALRDAIKEAQDNVAFLEGEAKNFLETARESRRIILREQAKECVRALVSENSPYHIPSWNDNLYTEIRTFAIGSGMDADVVNELVDPAAIKLLHMAFEYSKIQKASQSAKEKVKAKIAKAPKRTLSKTTSTGTSKTPSNVKKLAEVAKQTGELEDILAYMQAKAAAQED